MAKNMTRKGLAIGTTFALTLAGLVGIAAPAQASTGITVEPSAGTSYNMISGEKFSLRVFGQSNYTGGFSALKWEVTNASAATVSAFVPASTGAAAATIPATAVRDADFNPAGTSNASAATSFVITPEFIATATGANQLGLSVPDSVAATVQVRAFIDLNGNGSFESATDLSANVATVNWVKPADLTTTTTITSPTEGDTAIVASVSFNNINNEQVPAGDVGAYFTNGDGSTLYPTATITATSLTSNVATFTANNNFVAGQSVTIAGAAAAYNGARTIATRSATSFTVAITNADIAAATGLTGVTATSAASNSVKSNSTWSATDKFKFTSSTVSALVKSAGVKVQPLFKGAGSPASTDTVGSAQTAIVVARNVATIEGGVVTSTTASATSATAGDALIDSSFQVKVTVKDGSSPAKAVSGQAITATVSTGATLGSGASDKSVTINGTKYTAAGSLPGQGSVAKLSLTSNASGEATISVSTANLVDADSVSFTFYTENLTSSTLVVDLDPATYTVRQNKAVSGVVDGASAPVEVTVLDQFGGSIGSGYFAYATLASSSRATTNATSAGSGGEATVSGGRAVISLIENGTGVGTDTYTISVAKKLGNGGYDTALGSTVTHTVKIETAAALAAASIDSSTGTKNSTTGIYEVAGTNALVLQDLKDYNANNVVDAAPSAFSTAFAAGDIAIGGTVKTAASATVAATAVPGAAVTISGTGLQFSDGSGIFKANSITVYADASGVYSAAVSSNKAGKQTITVTSGSGTATITATFAEAADDTGTALAITAPDNILPGSTLTISVVLTDKYGNTVVTNGTAGDGWVNGATDPTFSFTSDSPGFQIGSDPTTTGKGGKATLRYFLGANDKGTITVTASYDADGTGTAKDAVTVTKTIVIGAAVAAQGTSVKRTGNTVAVRVTGYAKSRIVLNGVRVASRTTEGNLTRTLNLRAGRNVIQIVVDGKVIRTVRYTR